MPVYDPAVFSQTTHDVSEPDDQAEEREARLGQDMEPARVETREPQAKVQVKVV